jgi:hypothetical protein
MVADPNKWFLNFSPNGEGRPWGDDTYMAKRLGNYLDIVTYYYLKFCLTELLDLLIKIKY